MCKTGWTIIHPLDTCLTHRLLLNFWPCLGWLPYALLPGAFLSLLMLAPSVRSILGGVLKPKLLATFAKSNWWTSNTVRRLWLA